MRRFAVVSLAFAACVDPDPGPPDPATVVTVHVVDLARRPVAGLGVLGHDSAGQRVDDELTNSDGVAWLAVPAGGSITTHDDDPTMPTSYLPITYYTVLAVAPGDDILVRTNTGDSDAPLGLELDVTVPALPAGATAVRVTAPCVESGSINGTTAVLHLDARCPTAGAVVASALDAADQQIAYLVIANADLTQGQLAMPGPWVAPPPTSTVDVTGFPASGGTLALERGALVDKFVVHWDDLRLTATGPAMSTRIPQPGVGDGVVHRLAIGTSDFCTFQRQTYTRGRAADLGGFAVDLGDLLPPITTIGVGDHQMSWRGGGGGVAVTAWFRAARGSGDVIDGPPRSWGIVAPAGIDTVHFPADVDFVWPGGANAGDRVTAASVSEIASTRWASYAEVRQHHAEDSPQIDGDFVSRTTAAGGQYDYVGCPGGP